MNVNIDANKVRESEDIPIEPASRLIEKEQPWPHQDLKRNADPPPLSSTDASQMPIPDNCVGAILETHLYKGALHQCALLRPGHVIGKAQSSRI